MGGVMVGGKVAVFCLRTHGVYYGGHVAGMAGTAGTLAFIPACCTGSGMETPKQPCLTRQVDPGRACSRCPVNSTELPAYRSSQGAAVPLAPNVPSSKGLRGDPSGRKAGGMQGMGGGACLAWGLASSQSDGGLPPSPPDMQANICAQTSQDGEKEFHSCAHLRLRRLALTPSPP